MGNNNSRSTTSDVSNDTNDHPSNNSSDYLSVQQKGFPRSPSGAEIGEKSLTQFVPIEKLSQILKEKTREIYGINGINSDTFVIYVFPRYADLGHRLFKLFHDNSRAQTEHLGEIAFRQQCERFLGVIDDSKIIENYLKMYADADRSDMVTKDDLSQFLLTCFKVAMSHYTGASKICPFADRTIDSVLKAIFFSQDTLSIGFIARYMEQNCTRLILLVHKYVIHTLSTCYRGLEQSETSYGVELSTPVLEKGPAFDNNVPAENSLMPLSQAWLLAGTLPPIYSKPQAVTTGSPTGNNPPKCAMQTFKDKFSLIPSHWTLLYDSNQHGVGANRFLHHVLGYRGPTLILIHTQDDQAYCIASPSEWKETHLYTGGEDSCIIQLLPKFVIIEKKPNILCLNTSMRGYPKGLRAGSDPRKPVIAIDEHFEKVDCKGIPAILSSIEVWGCGDKVSREVQLDIKKWQIKEAERQRTVKLTAADWMENPDRYLLELGGRPNYNN
ncbi:uncharacterized protein LOC129615866 [Condylostylus longicornis]|uniref:uncharacterized protein LOC129615866 n=1 Tax=Condylostylus longicornis TaxID=2530218 RepID=UPI00244DEEC5|nr:uncharacterized protein LOC129615866 [Condylostylus longicornis]